MNTSNSVRNPGLDIVRCFALLCVVSIHFFLYTKFDLIPVVGFTAYVVMLARAFFTISVPLFLLLTGYLLGDRTLSVKYYKKLGKTYCVYVLASLCCIAFYFVYNLIIAHQYISLTEQFLNIFSFTASPYGWYMEMYFGLYLIIPFLNMCYNSLQTPRMKQWLVITMLFLTTVPSLLNIYRFEDIQWWLTPSLSNEYTILLPDYWQTLYPLSYYFLGCYLREYPLKITRRQNLLLIVVAFFVSGSFNYYRSYQSVFVFGPWQEYFSAFVVAQSVLVFQFLVQGDYSKLSEKTSRILARLSDLCMGAYLVSWIFDRIVYYFLNARFPEFAHRLPFFFIAVPVVYVCAMALSAGINLVYQLLSQRSA